MRWNRRQIELVDPRPDREHHFQIGEKRGQVTRRFPYGEVMHGFGIARGRAVRPDAKWNMRRFFGKETCPLRAAHRIGLVEEGHWRGPMGSLGA